MNIYKLFYFYQNTYKLLISFTPFEMIYRLHPSLPMEYLLLKQHINIMIDFEPICVLARQLAKLNKLQETQL